MTDKDIIKALVCCMNGYCDNCSFSPTREQCHSLDSLILDLINRQQAEIERLLFENDRLYKDIQLHSRETVKARVLYKNCLEQLETTKAEAYKECIEKIKEISEKETYCDNRLPKPIRTYHIIEDELDNLLKELVGE